LKKSGFDNTLEVLRTTRNDAAVAALFPALENPRPEVRQGALRSLLGRRNLGVQRELLSRWHLMTEEWKDIISERPGRLGAAIRDAILGSSKQLCDNGCDALKRLREYDLMPALITAAEDDTSPNGDAAAKTLLEMADILFEEATGPRDYNQRRDPQMVRSYVVTSLEKSALRYGKHGRREIVEAFLLLAKRNNPTLLRILADPLDKVYRPILQVLQHSKRKGVIRLLLSFLEELKAPASTIKLVATRTDQRFLRHLLRRAENDFSEAMASNVKRMEVIAWAAADSAVINRLDDASQEAAVKLMMASGVHRLELFPVMKRLAMEGKVGGRRAATAALAEFNGADANATVLAALDDPDPLVQAAAARQLRARGIPGAMDRLIQLVDSPCPQVEEAARQSLPEFSFDRFLTAFDLLEPVVRRSTGRLVRKIDSGAAQQLALELESKVRSRRLRGIAMTSAMGAERDLEDVLIGLVEDEDHIVRCEAVSALGKCDGPQVVAALRQALVDRSVSVQEAAERSLQQIARKSSSRTSLAYHIDNASPAADGFDELPVGSDTNWDLETAAEFLATSTPREVH